MHGVLNLRGTVGDTAGTADGMATESDRAISEKRALTVGSYGKEMITNVKLVSLSCLDQDKALDFYVNVLGFEPRTDISTGEDSRWLTVSHPSQPELEVALVIPGPPLDADAADFIRRQLEQGKMAGLGMQVDDCRETYEELSAKGVVFLQEPLDRPYGVEAVMRDNSGNWMALVEPKEFTQEDFA